MLTTTNLADCTATELLNLYRTGQASAFDATDAVLARASVLNQVIHAIFSVGARWTFR